MVTPSMLERYVIIERMAVGGMGEVFLARQEGVGGFRRTVVLKKLLPDVEGNDDAAHRLLDEARIVAALSHENVVAIIEVGTDQGLPVMALEYVHGENAGTLRNRASKRDLQIPVAVAARIVADCARGLHHAHTATDVDGRPLKIVHRDIAPKNIFVRTDGVAKVGDFGIASAEQRLAKTATGAVTGTLSYMSPEQLTSKPLTSASDQWSLGVVLWELLTGYRLFKHDGPAEVIEAILNSKLRSPRRLRDGVPRELSDVCKSMLERDPLKRMASLEAVAITIEAAVPDCQGAPGRAALQAFVEDMCGDDLRDRLRRIEEGAEVTSRAARPEHVGQTQQSGLYGASPSPSGSVQQAPRTNSQSNSGQTMTVPEGLRMGPTGSGVAAPPVSQRRRLGSMIAVAAAVAVVVTAGAGLAWTLAQPPDPATLTREALARHRPGRALVLREEVLEDASELDAAVLAKAPIDDVATTLVTLCNQRLDLNIAHWQQRESDRQRTSAALAAAESDLETAARKALAPFGEPFASTTLDLWAEECWAPIRWLEPASVVEVQSAVRTRVVPQIEDTASWRESVVRRLLKRAGADVDSVMQQLWPIVVERQALIARYAAVSANDLDELAAKYDAREAAGRALLQQHVTPEFENAIAQIAFIDFDDKDNWVPLYNYLPSVRAREPGARQP